MAITKRKLGERLFRIVNAGSTKPELKIKIQDCMLAVAQARDKVVVQAMFERNLIGDHSVPYDLISTFDLTVQDGQVTLPRRGLTILKHNSGVYRVVCRSCDQEEELIPTERGNSTLFSGQPSRDLEGRPSYYPLRDKLFTRRIADGEVISVDMIVAGEEFDLNEFFCVPPEMQADIIQMAAQDLGVMIQTPEDIITDAKSNQ